MLRIWPENTLLTRAPRHLTEDRERSQTRRGHGDSLEAAACSQTKDFLPPPAWRPSPSPSLGTNFLNLRNINYA